MHDVVGSQNLECFDELVQILNNFVLRQASALPNFLVECASIAKLIKEVKVIDGLEYLDEPDYIRRIDLCEHFDLIKRAFLQFRIVFETLDVDHLHCYFLAVSAVDAAVHLSIFSLADLLVKCVIFDDLDHRYFQK